MHWIPRAQKGPPRSNVRLRATLRDLRLLQLPLSHLEVQGLRKVLVLEPTLSHLEFQLLPRHLKVHQRAPLSHLGILQLPLSHLEVLEHPQGLGKVLVLEPTLSHLESVLPRHLELLTLRQTLSYLESGQSKWLKLHCSAKASFQQGRSLVLRA